MIRLFQDAIRAIWQILLLVPMPWRAALTIGATIVLGYQIVRRLLPLSLLPEFWITSQLRRLGSRPLPGTYAFGEFIGWAIQASRWLAWGGVMVAGIGIIAWYARPSMDDTMLAGYVDQGITRWYSLEGWVLTGKWVPLPMSMENLAPKPAPSRTTPTPKATATRTPRPTRTLTPAAYEIYVVQEGDYLSKIAKRFGVTVEDIVEANRKKYPSLVTDPGSIEIGWELLIPQY